MTDNAQSHGAYYAKPRFIWKFWRALGYGWRGPKDDTDRHEWSDLHEEGFAPYAFSTHVHFRLDFADRIRLLVSGRAEVEVRTKSDVQPLRLKSRSWIRICAPGER